MKMKAQSGFTIIELMAVVAVAGVLAAVAIPSFQNMIRSNCITTSTNLLVSSLQFARSEAIKRRQTISVSGNPNWSAGWAIYQDLNSSGGFNTGEELRLVGLTCGQGGDNPLSFTEASNETKIDYLPTGFASPAATFDICFGESGDRGRQITLLLTGRPNTNTDYVCP